MSYIVLQSTVMCPFESCPHCSKKQFLKCLDPTGDAGPWMECIRTIKAPTRLVGKNSASESDEAVSKIFSVKNLSASKSIYNECHWCPICPESVGKSISVKPQNICIRIVIIFWVLYYLQGCGWALHLQRIGWNTSDWFCCKHNLKHVSQNKINMFVTMSIEFTVRRITIPWTSKDY